MSGTFREKKTKSGPVEETPALQDLVEGRRLRFTGNILRMSESRHAKGALKVSNGWKAIKRKNGSNL